MALQVESISFTSIHDEQNCVYVLDVTDPQAIYNPCCFDKVTVLNHLHSYVQNVAEYVNPRGMQIYDINWDRMSQDYSSLRMCRPTLSTPKILPLSDYHVMRYGNVEESDDDDDSTASMDVEDWNGSTYFGKAMPVPMHMREPPMVQQEEITGYFTKATSVPLEMREQPKSAPDLFYIAIKATNEQGQTMLLRLYQRINQHVRDTPVYLMNLGETITDVAYANLIKCLKDNPQWKVLLAEQVVPYLVQFVKSVAEKYYPRSATSSVESMDWADVEPLAVEGLVDYNDGIVDQEPLSAASPAKPKREAAELPQADSGFNSNIHSISLNRRIAREEEKLANGAEADHFSFSLNAE